MMCCCEIFALSYQYLQVVFPPPHPTPIAAEIYHCVFGDLEESLQSCCTNALESASEEQLRRIAFWMDGFVSIQGGRVVETCVKSIVNQLAIVFCCTYDYNITLPSSPLPPLPSHLPLPSYSLSTSCDRSCPPVVPTREQLLQI